MDRGTNHGRGFFCMNNAAITLFLALFSLSASLALFCARNGNTGYPTAQISNSQVTMDFYLPDPEKGYYRGTRFDWSGIVSSTRYKGHEYFGEWKEGHDPFNHDDICGPVEAFQTRGAGLGYHEAAPGGEFVRIGIGVLRKPDEEEYRWSHTYEMIDPGKWTISQGQDWIEFVHELETDDGWGYVYSKKVELKDNEPGFTLLHVLENSGSRTIETDQYNHNFFVIDGGGTGPGFTVEFPFHPESEYDFRGIMEIRDNRFVFLQELIEGEIYGRFTGFGPTADDHRITIKKNSSGAGVRIAVDLPLHRLAFWAIHKTLCPENFIYLTIEPGEKETWVSDYTLFTAGE